MSERPPDTPADQPERDVTLTPEQVERLDAEALLALNFTPTSATATGRRGCRTAIIILGVGGFVGIVISTLLVRSVTNRSGGITLADRNAQVALTNAVAKAQTIAATTQSFALADPLALSTEGVTFVEETQPSTGPKVVSVRHQPFLFVVAAMGAEKTCWFLRTSSDPSVVAAPWNRAVDVQTCAATLAPIDGWAAEPPTP